MQKNILLKSMLLVGVLVFQPVHIHLVQAQTQTSSEQVRIDKDMEQVLAKLQEFALKPIETLSAQEARLQSTPSDAVKALMVEQGKPVSMRGVSKEDITWQGPGGVLPARVYKPSQASQNQALPVIVYYHGGGWVIADLDTYEASALALARKARAIVVAVEYRHAPENKFPAAHEDAFAAYQWVISNAKNLGGDPDNVAVVGESAGGNLAANVAIMARDRQIQAPVHMTLIYPVTSTSATSPSYEENRDAKPLNAAMMNWFLDKVVSGPQDLNNPMLHLFNAKLDNLPPSTVITAQIDPLRSEGAEFARKLKQAGNKVKYQNFSGVTHEFFGMDAVVSDANRAQNIAASNLRAAFANNIKTSTTGSRTGGSSMD